MGDPHVERLGGDRVGLPPKFLGEKIERSPGRVLIEQTVELVDVTLQPYQFLGDVGAISHEGYLAGNVGVGERRRPVGQEFADPLQQPVAVGDHHLGHALADSSCQRDDFAAAAPHVGRERGSLGPPHLVVPVEGHLEGPCHQGPCPVCRRGIGLLVEEDPRQAKQRVGRDRQGEIVRRAEVGEVVEIGSELGLVEPASRHRGRSRHIERHLHSAAADAAADRGLDPGFERREALTSPQ